MSLTNRNARPYDAGVDASGVLCMAMSTQGEPLVALCDAPELDAKTLRLDQSTNGIPVVNGRVAIKMGRSDRRGHENSQQAFCRIEAATQPTLSEQDARAAAGTSQALRGREA